MCLTFSPHIDGLPQLVLMTLVMKLEQDDLFVQQVPKNYNLINSQFIL